MVVSVDPDLMPLGRHTLHQVPVPFQHFSHQEKGGVNPPLGQTVQQLPGGGAAGAVVESDGDEGRVRLQLSGTLCRHRLPGPKGQQHRPGKEQGQAQGQRAPCFRLFHIHPVLPFCHRIFLWFSMPGRMGFSAVKNFWKKSGFSCGFDCSAIKWTQNF